MLKMHNLLSGKCRSGVQLCVKFPISLLLACVSAIFMLLPLDWNMVLLLVFTGGNRGPHKLQLRVGGKEGQESRKLLPSGIWPRCYIKCSCEKRCEIASVLALFCILALMRQDREIMLCSIRRKDHFLLGSTNIESIVNKPTEKTYRILKLNYANSLLAGRQFTGWL